MARYYSTYTYLGVHYSVASNMTKPVGKFSFEPWFQCSQCALDFPKAKTMLYKGKRYGIPCGCYKDIAQLVERDR